MRKEIKEKYQLASDEMLHSLKEDKLEHDEKQEWYGYLRGVRDCAYDAGILNETTIQQNLEEALKIILKK